MILCNNTYIMCMYVIHIERVLHSISIVTIIAIITTTSIRTTIVFTIIITRIYTIATIIISLNTCFGFSKGRM